MSKKDTKIQKKASPFVLNYITACTSLFKAPEPARQCDLAPVHNDLSLFSNERRLPGDDAMQHAGDAAQLPRHVAGILEDVRRQRQQPLAQHDGRHAANPPVATAHTTISVLLA